MAHWYPSRPGPARIGAAEHRPTRPILPLSPTVRRGALITLVAALGVATVLTLGATRASAHGALQAPASRAYACHLEGPENPQSAACKAAVAAGGTQALYDWNGIASAQAGADYPHAVPDGHLCGAGNPEFAGFDLAREDWPATPLTAGATYQFRWAATAPHQGSFSFFVTRDGYDPGQPLRWADLEARPFLTVDHPPLVGGVFQMSGRLPANKQGRHLIYTVYLRSDSPEDFFSCSDVVFSGAGAAVPPATGDPTGTPPGGSSAPSPAMSHDMDTMPGMPGGPASAVPPPASSSPPVTSGHPAQAAPWQLGMAYQAGAEVTVGGVRYQCLIPHTALPGWEPPNVPALWRALPGPTDSTGAAPWQAGAAYPLGAAVVYQGVRYVCVQAHTALLSWEPPNVPALWTRSG